MFLLFSFIKEFSDISEHFFLLLWIRLYPMLFTWITLFNPAIPWGTQVLFFQIGKMSQSFFFYVTYSTIKSQKLHENILVYKVLTNQVFMNFNFIFNSSIKNLLICICLYIYICICLYIYFFSNIQSLHFASVLVVLFYFLIHSFIHSVNILWASATCQLLH